MTEDQLTHPLTEEKALSLFSFERLMDTGRPITIADAMRTAADWQLEQVMIWLKSQKDDPGPLYYDLSTLESIECSLRQAMRPTTTQEDK